MHDVKLIEELQSENQKLREDLQHLQSRLALLEASSNGKKDSHPIFAADEAQNKPKQSQASAAGASGNWTGVGHNLSKEQVERYSRQILHGSMGAEAQAALCEASVLVIGAGGLGCPAAIYLAASGIGHIGIVDHDHVELSNLHRQVLHTEAGIGTHKADSAAAACKALNSSIQVNVFRDGFLPHNALEIAKQFQIVVDATDNVPTRYLISDVCCILDLPLVSGAAIGTEGQLTVYCHNDGPCYRCLFPHPPSPENCSRCSEAGVLGPVPGVIGTLQALEVLKLATGIGTVGSQSLLLADFLSGRFTRVKLRGKQRHCVACGPNQEITQDNLASYDYLQFTGQPYNDRYSTHMNVANPGQRIDAKGFLGAYKGAQMLDVRPFTQFNTAHIPGSVHLPFDEHNPQLFQAKLDAYMASTECGLKSGYPVIVVCRRGNDSQVVAKLLSDEYAVPALDLEGGLTSLAQYDSSFPLL